MSDRFECVTSMNQSYYDKIGYKMLSSFVQKWPEDIKLRLYHEDDLVVPCKGNFQKIDLFKTEPELFNFIERHKDRGDQSNPLELHRGAVRFAYKTFSILNAAANSKANYLIWIDADTYTHTNITHDFLNELVSPDTFATYLGRENNYSECGFVIYNLEHPVRDKFFGKWRELYERDTLFSLEQWHDSFVFDRLREYFEQHDSIKNNNISPWGKNYDHVFINSILGEYMDHMKGPRKDKGKSNKNDLFKNKKNNYWIN